MPQTPTLNLLGAGRLGRSVGRLIATDREAVLQDVLTTRADSAVSAVAFIGAGRAVHDLAALRPADLWLLTPPDAVIAPLAMALAGTGLLRAGDVVCHCSGALPSSLLAPLRAAGASVASMHPLKSFADPAASAASFAGTWCTAEGDAAALQCLQPLFERLGARVARMDAAGKTLYHAAAVLMCNDLVALLEAGLRSAEAAGLARGAALEMFAPLVRETLDNVFRLGPARALTGPVLRGDAAVVQAQHGALEALDPRLAGVYRALAVVALELARAQGANPAALAAVDAVLKK
jgi:predicted short-subunit dehydrogenase-like oxidoreductase (DUF2520 family)